MPRAARWRTRERSSRHRDHLAAAEFRTMPRALLALVCLAALAGPASAQSIEVFGYAGVLGEWELNAEVAHTLPGDSSTFSGPLTMQHVGICTQAGPEEKRGEISLLVSLSQLDATLTFTNEQCSFTGTLSAILHRDSEVPRSSGRAAQALVERTVHRVSLMAAGEAVPTRAGVLEARIKQFPARLSAPTQVIDSERTAKPLRAPQQSLLFIFTSFQ
jgi:hypothetical protein